MSLQPHSTDLPLLRTLALPVEGGHVLHVQEFGSAEGIPALVLHGGPGSGCSPVLRRGFDARQYRVICVDQRGAGLSRPRGGIQHNTTGHLLADLHILRRRLGIARWLVCGGSWGAALAIAHAADEPEAVSGLLLRASFLARREDIDGFFAEAPPLPAQGDLVADFCAAVEAADEVAQARLALAWWKREQALATGRTDGPPPSTEALAALIDRYRVQSHYLRHGCWLADPPLPERCAAVPRVPTLVLHGTNDRICPPRGARLLHESLPGSSLQWIEGAGHDPGHPAMAAATRTALDRHAHCGELAPAA